MTIAALAFVVAVLIVLATAPMVGALAFALGGIVLALALAAVFAGLLATWRVGGSGRGPLSRGGRA